MIEAVERQLDVWLEVEERPAVPGLGVRSSAARRHREARAATEQVFDAVDQPMLLLTPDGVIQDANSALLELVGLIDVPVGMLLHELVDRGRGPLAGHPDARTQLATARTRPLPGTS